MRTRSAVSLVVLVLLLTACAAPGAPTSTPSGARETDAPATPDSPPAPLAERIVFANRGEPSTLAAITSITTTTDFQMQEFASQSLTSIDQDGVPVPKLAAEIPSVDTGSWTMKPDGTMDITYRLRANAVWHDGTPVTTDDVIFTLQVYQDRQVPIFFRLVDPVQSIEALDAHTFVMHWNKVYAFADRLTILEFTVIPKHLLATAYETDPVSFANLPYWTDGFIGTGPYRLASWVHGSQMEFEAFDQYFLGAPKTPRLTVRFFADENAMLAQILAGEVDVATALGVNSAAVLTPQLEEFGLGKMEVRTNGYRHWTFQYNNNPAAAPLQDLRVRQAMAMSLDRTQIADFGTAGFGGPVDSWIPPEDPRFKAAEPYLTKYPYDPNRALGLFQEAGWIRGSDGTLRNGGGQPLQCDIRATSQAEMGVIAVGADMWRAVGIDTSETLAPANLLNDPQYRATFPCIESSARPAGLSIYTHLHSNNAVSAANGWKGNNRSGWSDPELDKAIDRFLGSPRESDREAAEREMVQIVTAQLPLIPTYLSISTSFIGRGVTGMEGDWHGIWPEGSVSWNAYQWEKH